MINSKRNSHAEPELRAGTDVERLGDVEAQEGALNEAEPGDIEAEAGADCMGGGANGMAVGVHIAHVVEWHEIDIAQTEDVVAEVKVEIARHREPPFGAADPNGAALALGQIEAAEIPAAAHAEKLAAAGHACSSKSPQCQSRLSQPLERSGQPRHVGHGFGQVRQGLDERELAG